MINIDKRIALLGAGYWGRNILRNLNDMGVLYAVCDPDHNVVSEWREKLPGIKYSTSFEDILKDDSISAVVIATPAVTHYKLAKAFLISGKDVLTEKPIAMKTGEAKELVKISKSKKRVLMVGHILQYHSAVDKLKELIAQGRLGDIQYIYSNRLNIGKLRKEEDILWSFAPHDISVVLSLVDKEPVRVKAFGGCYLNKKVYDTTLTALDFEGHIKAHIFVSWLHPYKEQKLVVVGSRAMAVFDDIADDKLCIYPHTIEWKEGHVPVAHKADREIVPVAKNEPLRVELEHFIDCVAKRIRPKTDGEEGLRVLRVIEKAHRSLRRKGR